MSLIRLLAVGRTLGLVRDERSPYRMSRRRLLPRFESDEKRNESKEPRLGAMHKASLVAGSQDAINRIKTMNKPVAAGPVAVSTGGETSNQRFPLGRWTPFSRSPFKQAAPAAPPEPTQVRVPAQAELSLETVKPVRNDLTDSDLMIVPARPASSAPPPAAPAASGKPVTPVWSRLRTQFFGGNEC